MLADSSRYIESNCRAEIYPLESSEVLSRPHRLEAGFYASEGYRAVQAMEGSGFPMLTVKDCADVRWYGIQKRILVKDSNHGVPYVDTSGMMEARPQPALFLSKTQTTNLSFYIVQKGTILMSKSGTVGNICLVDKRMDGWAVTVDTLRIIPKDNELLGLVYCYLQNPLGQFLIKRSQSGSVVTHIYEDDIKILPIPDIPRNLKKELTRLILEASDLRVEANRLLDEADTEVQRQLNLPNIEEFEEVHRSDASTFVVNGSEQIVRQRDRGMLRLDTAYHAPAAVNLQKFILSKRNGMRLAKVLYSVRDSALRKRVYVDKGEDGIPLFGGKLMIKLRQNDVSFISRLHTRNLKNEMVDKHWSLVSSGGTIGRTVFVHRNFERSVFSQDVMRVIPNTSEVWPGFIYAFLSSVYGRTQILQQAYGSVIPRLRDFQIGSISICLPNDKGESIHNMVVAAYDARADAIQIEDLAFDLYNEAILEGRRATEVKWGEEY